MTFLKTIPFYFAVLFLAACAQTPEQQAEREAKRVRAEQEQQVKLARECDAETADLMHEKFNPPLNQTEKARKAFEKRYVKKVEDPMFQACYKMAWQNYKAQQEIEEMRRQYENDVRIGVGFGFGRYCYACW